MRDLDGLFNYFLKNDLLDYLWILFGVGNTGVIFAVIELVI